MIKYFLRFFEKYKSVFQSTNSKVSFLYFTAVMASLPSIMRTKSLMSADRLMHKLMRKRYVSFKIGEETIIWPGEYFSAGREIFCDKPYFVLPGFDVNKGDMVIDLGAGVGDFATLCAVKGATVISVEALEGLLPIIMNNLEINNVSDNVFLEWGMIDSTKGAFSELSNLKASDVYTGYPPVLTMEQLIEKYNIDKINFLKMDIEGSEFALFTEDADWLSIVQKIAMEIHLDYGDVNDMIKILQKRRFKCWLGNKDFKIIPKLNSNIGFLYAKKI